MFHKQREWMMYILSWIEKLLHFFETMSSWWGNTETRCWLTAPELGLGARSAVYNLSLSLGSRGREVAQMRFLVFSRFNTILYSKALSVCRDWGGMGWERCVPSCKHGHVSECVGRGKEWLMDALSSRLRALRDKEKGEETATSLNTN